MGELTQFIRRNALRIIVLAVAGITPAIFQNPYVLSVLVVCLLLGIAATGWSFAYGNGGLLSFGHIVFFGIGSYSVVMSIRFLGLTPWASVLIGAALAALFGMLITWLTARTRGFYFALCTFVIPPLFLAIWTWDLKPLSAITGGPMGLSIPYYGDSLFYMQFNSRLPYYYIALVFLLFSYLLVMKINGSNLGYQIKAMGEEEDAAESIGIDTLRIKILCMSLSAFVTGIAGGLYANSMYFADPYGSFGWILNLRIILCAMLGGPGTMLGPLIGALIIIGFSELMKTFLETWVASGIHLVIYGVVLMLVVVKMPDGVYPKLRNYLRRKYARI